MPHIVVSPLKSPHATEFTWTLSEFNRLAVIVADIALGQVEHAESILQAKEIPLNDQPTQGNIEEAIKLVSGTPVDHRDGWLFQVLSWVAWNDEGEMTLIRAPLPTATRQGFDGVSLALSEDSSTVEFVMVSEDKATLNPRSVIRDDVLPEFGKLAKGHRESQLRAELVTLLKAGGFDPASLLKQGDWRNRKRFRASVCTSKDRLPSAVELYEGFEVSAPGDPLIRRGHRLVFTDMRVFFGTFSAEVVKALESLGGGADV